MGILLTMPNIYKLISPCKYVLTGDRTFGFSKVCRLCEIVISKLVFRCKNTVD